jgi:hypothetical protein
MADDARRNLGGEPLVPPLTEFGLSRFEDDDEVFREFLAGTPAGLLDTGDISVQYEEEAETAQRFLGHPLRRVRAWVVPEIESDQLQAQSAKGFLSRVAKQDARHHGVPGP